MRAGKGIVIGLVVAILLLGAALGVFYFYLYDQEPEKIVTGEDISESIIREYTTLKIYRPMGGKVELVEKKVPGILSILDLADILMEEYLKASTELDTGVLPEGTKLNNLFMGADGVLYLDFNREFERNFRGDVLDEYMLLKSIFDTLISNLDVMDVMILVDGKETESIGGHFMINRPLKAVLNGEVAFEEAPGEGG